MRGSLRYGSGPQNGRCVRPAGRRWPRVKTFKASGPVQRSCSIRAVDQADRADAGRDRQPVQPISADGWHARQYSRTYILLVNPA